MDSFQLFLEFVDQTFCHSQTKVIFFLRNIMKACERWRCSFTHLNVCIIWKLVISCIKRAVVPQEKMSVPFEQRAVWAADPMQTLWPRKKAFIQAANRNTNYRNLFAILTEPSRFPPSTIQKPDCEFSTTLFFSIFWISVCSYDALHLGVGKHFGSLSYRRFCGRHIVLKKR